MKILFIIYLVGVLYNIIALWNIKTDTLQNLIIALVAIAGSWVSVLVVHIAKLFKKL